MKKVLLVSIKVMHYRVSNYNYFAREFNKLGYEFILRTNEIQKDNPHPLEFDHKVIPFNFLNYKKEIEKIKPDVVILFLLLKNFIIWPLIHWLKLKKIPVVYWNKGINLEVQNPYIRNQFFYYIHNICDAIILYSNNEVKDIKEKNRKKIFIANNTINFSDFPQINMSVEEIKKEFSIPFKKYVLFVGRMRDIKRVDHLIKVFHSINDREIGLVIVGNEMKQNINTKINKKNTIYLGEIYDSKHIQISKIFKAADVFCIPGEVGLGLNQAFFWGLPVVTEAIPSQPPEIIYMENNANGFIVPDNDIKELMNKLIYLLKNDEIRKVFSLNARKTIFKNADIRHMFFGFKKCIEFLDQKKLCGSMKSSIS